MRRALMVLVGTVLALGSLAGPVRAKVSLENVAITGPGLAEPIELAMDDGWTFMIGTGRAPQAVTPSGELGPEFQVTFRTQGYSVRDWRLEFYPYAEQGALLRIGHAKTLKWMIEWGERPEHTGWVELSRTQLMIAQDHGLPEALPVESARAAPAVPASERAATPVSDREAPVAPIAGISLVAVAGVLALLRATSRRRGAASGSS
jgi:hypothetical protein